ncbi:hypothetical protein BDK51DRAFT_30444, partial [Blyttiomyces helicus]
MVGEEGQAKRPEAAPFHERLGPSRAPRQFADILFQTLLFRREPHTVGLRRLGIWGKVEPQIASTTVAHRLDTDTPNQQIHPTSVPLHPLPLRQNTMTRGNQREKAREKAQKKGEGKGLRKDDMTHAQRKE